MATALLAGWGSSEFTGGLLGIVKPHLSTGGLLEGRNLVDTAGHVFSGSV